MSRQVLVPIVEGDGEVQAIGVLLRRLFEHHQVYDVEIGKPIRRPRYQLVKPGEIEIWARRAAERLDCVAVLVLIDADDDCPATTGPVLRQRAEAALGHLPVFVVLAKRELEAWFLAGIEGLRGKRRISRAASPPPEPEEIRGAKERLSTWMPPHQPYAETTDQAALCQRFDLALAYQRSRSFRKLWKDMADLVARLGVTPGDPPQP